MTFTQNQKVITPLGEGRVAYQIMKAPDYIEPQSVCVVLEAKRSYLSYNGTMFPAEDVKECCES